MPRSCVRQKSAEKFGKVFSLAEQHFIPSDTVESEMTIRTVEDLLSLGQAARRASRQVARLFTDVKNRALNMLATSLETDADEVLDANA